MEYVNWIPTTVTVALVGALIWILRAKVTKLETDYMTKDTHENLCKIAHLEFQKYVAKEMRELKEDYLEGKFKGLVDVIKNNGK